MPSSIYPDPTGGGVGHTEDHDHDGAPTQKLSQANTHESPDTDAAPSSLHHTLGTGANQAAAGDDARLSDARTPTAHSIVGAQHNGFPGGTTDFLRADGSFATPPAGGGYTDEQAQDAIGTILVDSASVDFTYSDATPSITAAVLPAGIKLDDLGAPDDNTDLNATTSAHGLLPKLGGGSTNFLRADGTWAAPAGGGGIDEGTSFPGSPAADDLFYRTDRNMIYFYDGTRWLTVNEYDLGIGFVDTSGTAGLSASAILSRWPVRQDFGIFLTRWNSVAFQSNATPASNNMTVTLSRLSTANVVTTITSFQTNGHAQNTWVNYDQAINAVLDSSARVLRTNATEAGTVTGFISVSSIAYRLIG